MKYCWDDEHGGFCGGPWQQPQLAATYAAACCIVILNTPNAYLIANKQKLYSFILSKKHKYIGRFEIHENGEYDIRGVYCAIVVAYIFNILDKKLAESVNEYIAKCQTFEGGIAGEPFNEAHGGYTYCGIASACILHFHL